MAADKRLSEITAEAQRFGTTVQDAAKAWIEHKKKLATKRLGWLLLAGATYVLGLATGLQF